MKSRTLILAVVAIPLVATLFSSCAGYSPGASQPSQYAGIKKLYVPTFENDTLEPRLASLVTNAVISQLQQDGTYQVTDQKNSDATLVGKVRQVRRQQQRSANNNILRTREMLVTLVVSYYLKDSTGVKIEEANIYGVDKEQRDVITGQRREGGQVTGTSTIFLDPNFQLSEREALPLAAEDAAEQIVSFISEGW